MIRRLSALSVALLLLVAGCARMPPEAKVPEPRATILRAMLMTGIDPNPSEAKTVDAPLMFQVARFAYSENDELQVLDLPYAGYDLSMIVLLPRTTDGLSDIEAKLTGQYLNAWTRPQFHREVEVFLPKFKMTSKFSLSDKLSELGMTDAFSSKADFSGMNDSRDLYISAVLHTAFVDVNEEGCLI